WSSAPRIPEVSQGLDRTPSDNGSSVSMTMIRSAGLHGFRALVTELGGDADDIAARAGLPVAALETSDALVPDAAVATALETAASELGCPDFGLRMARRQDLNLLGPLGLAVKHSESLGTALRYV